MATKLNCCSRPWDWKWSDLVINKWLICPSPSEVNALTEDERSAVQEEQFDYERNKLMINKPGTIWRALYDGQQGKMYAEVIGEHFFISWNSEQSKSPWKVHMHLLSLQRHLSGNVLGKADLTCTLSVYVHKYMYQLQGSSQHGLEISGGRYQIGSFFPKGVPILNLRCMWSGLISKAVICFTFVVWFTAESNITQLLLNLASLWLSKHV